MDRSRVVTRSQSTLPLGDEDDTDTDPYSDPTPNPHVSRIEENEATVILSVHSFVSARWKSMFRASYALVREKHKKKGAKVPPKVTELVAEMVKRSVSSVKRIVAAGNRGEAYGTAHSSPGSGRALDEYFHGLHFSSLVHQHLLQNNVKSGLGTDFTKIHKELSAILHSSHNISISYDTMRRLLISELGVKRRRGDQKHPLRESRSVIAKRVAFLSYAHDQIANLAVPLVFFDEVAFHENSPNKVSLHTVEDKRMTKRSGTGRRIVLLAAFEYVPSTTPTQVKPTCRFLKDTALFLIDNGEITDYKCESGTMTQTKFEDWMENQLLPNIRPGSIIVFDNATIHCRDVSCWLPSRSKAKKGEIIEWLEKNTTLSLRNTSGKYFTKPVLYEMAKELKPAPEYAVDKRFIEKGIRFCANWTILTLFQTCCPFAPLPTIPSTSRSNSSGHG